MRNRDSAAYPKANPYVAEPGGLTKREAAAIAAMQGILACGMHTTPPEDMSQLEAIAQESVAYADALFDELEKDAP